MDKTYYQETTEEREGIVNYGKEEEFDRAKILLEEICSIKEDLNYLRDLFIRRLSDDKQKSALIQKLADSASFSYIEPFLHEIILLLDRLEKSDDDFVASVREELYDIIHRRGVDIIQVSSDFDPSIHKAVKVVENQYSNSSYVSAVIRNGYTFNGKVIRPAEVIVVKSNK